MLEAEKVEALCDVRILLSVTAPGDAPMKETVVVIMLAPELLRVSCRLQSMYDGLAAVKTTQDSPQRRDREMLPCNYWVSQCVGHAAGVSACSALRFRKTQLLGYKFSLPPHVTQSSKFPLLRQCPANLFEPHEEIMHTPNFTPLSCAKSQPTNHAASWDPLAVPTGLKLRYIPASLCHQLESEAEREVETGRVR